MKGRNARFFCSASYGLDESVWTSSGTGEGPPLAFRRLDGELKSLACAIPPLDDENSSSATAASASSTRRRRRRVVDAATFDRGDGFVVNFEQLLPFVFPAGIRLYDPRRVRDETTTTATPVAAVAAVDGSTRSVNVSQPQPPSVTLKLPASTSTTTRTTEELQCKLMFHDTAAALSSHNDNQTLRSSMHSFMCTSQTATAEPYYGHVLTRWHQIADPAHVALLRLQLGATEVLSGAEQRAASVGVGSGSEGWGQQNNPSRRQTRSSSCCDVNVWAAEDLRALASAGGSMGALHAAAQCWEPSAIVIVTGEPYYESMRAVLSSLDAHLAPDARLDESAARLVFAALGQGEMPYDATSGVVCKGGLLELPVEGNAAVIDSRNFGSNTGLLVSALPWCSDACAATAAATAHVKGIPNAHAALPVAVVFPPSHSHSWELPQGDWTCRECGVLASGVSRADLRAAAAGGAPLDAPLGESLRCVETNACLKCTARGASVGEAAELAATAAREAAQRGEPDALLPFVCVSEDGDGGSGRVGVRSSWYAGVPKTVPLPFCMPSAGSALPALDIDVRALFAAVQPRNIIAVVTALLAERKVLVVSRDTSRLADAVAALLALIQPLPWAGCLVPVLPPYGLPPLSDLVSAAPIPVLVGCHPDAVRSSPPAYHSDIGFARKFSDAECAAAIADWEAAAPPRRAPLQPTTGSGDSGCATASGVCDPGASPWRPVPLRWWLRYAHLLDPAVAEWAEADAERAAEKEAGLAAERKAKAARVGGAWASWRPSSPVVTPDIASPIPAGPDGVGSFDDGYAHSQPVDAFWNNGDTASPSGDAISMILKSTWVATIGLGMDLPPATHDEGSRDSDAGGGGDGGGDGNSVGSPDSDDGRRLRSGVGVGGGAIKYGTTTIPSTPMAKGGGESRAATRRAPLSSASLIILDLDADALSPAYLPPTHLLPPQLAARLWRACATYAPLWSWARAGAPLPSPLPHFPAASPPAEVAAAHDLWREFESRSQIRGSLAASSSPSLRFDSIFAPVPVQLLKRPPLIRAPASLRTIDYVHSDDEAEDIFTNENESGSGGGGGGGNYDNFFCAAEDAEGDDDDLAPVPLSPPWALWRAGMTAAQAGLQGDTTKGPEPPVHFARVRLAFLSTFVSLVKGFRLYATIEDDEGDGLTMIPSAANDDDENEGRYVDSDVAVTATTTAVEVSGVNGLGGGGGVISDTISAISEAVASMSTRTASSASILRHPSSTSVVHQSPSLAPRTPQTSRSRVASMCLADPSIPLHDAVTQVRSRAMTFSSLTNASRIPPPLTLFSPKSLDDNNNNGELDTPYASPDDPHHVSSSITPTNTASSIKFQSSFTPRGGGGGLALEHIAQPFLHSLGPSEPRPALGVTCSKAPHAVTVAALSSSSSVASPISIRLRSDSINTQEETPITSTTATTTTTPTEQLTPSLISSVIPTKQSSRVVEVSMKPLDITTVRERLSSITSANSATATTSTTTAVVPSSSSSLTSVVIVNPIIDNGTPARVIWNAMAFIQFERSTSAVRYGGSILGGNDPGGSAEALLSHLSSCLHWSAFVDARLCRQWESIGTHLHALALWRSAVAAGRARARALLSQGPVLLILPTPPTPPALAEPDVFDRLCFERLLHRDWRLRAARSSPMAGTLWKANRGTLCKNWSRRHFVLGLNGVFAYYGKPDEVKAAERCVAIARARLPAAASAMAAATAAHAARNLSSSSDSARSIGGGTPSSSGGGGGGPVDNGAPAAHADARLALERAQAALSMLLAAEYRDRFELVPGKTHLRIPPTNTGDDAMNGSGGVSMLPSLGSGASDFVNNGASFPTRFPFQLVSRAPREEVLTLCAESAASRREWILRIRAYLRPMASATPAWLLAHHLDAAPVGAAVSSVSLFLRLLYLGDADSLGAIAALDDDDDNENKEENEVNEEEEEEEEEEKANVVDGILTSQQGSGERDNASILSIFSVPSSAALSTVDEAIKAAVDTGDESNAARNTASLVHDEYRAAILLQTRGN